MPHPTRLPDTLMCGSKHRSFNRVGNMSNTCIDGRKPWVRLGPLDGAWADAWLAPHLYLHKLMRAATEGGAAT